MDRFEAIETAGDNHVGGWVKTADGVKLWVEVRGIGHPILLVHGWTMSSRFWRRQEALSDSYQIITLDLRGHGKSQSTLRGHTVSRYARDVREVITALGISDITLIGWSLGGSVVMDYWQQYGRDALSAIGLVETGPYPMSPEPWNTHRYHGHALDTMRSDLKQMVADRDTFGSNFINNMFLSGNAPSHAMKWMKSEHLKVSDQTATTIYEDYVQRDYTPVLPTITIPSLAVYGRSRHMCYGPSTGRYVAGSMHDSRFVILDKSGHMPFYEEADEFNAAIHNFVNQLH